MRSPCPAAASSHVPVKLAAGPQARTYSAGYSCYANTFVENHGYPITLCRLLTGRFVAPSGVCLLTAGRKCLFGRVSKCFWEKLCKMMATRLVTSSLQSPPP